MAEYSQKRVQQKRQRRLRAHRRLRRRIHGTPDRPRLAVHKSSRYVYAQVIDDAAGRTLVQASSLDSEVRGSLEGSTGNVEAAKAVGRKVAERAKSQGIEQVVFDRGGYIYHGKVKALAEAAREAGLNF